MSYFRNDLPTIRKGMSYFYTDLPNLRMVMVNFCTGLPNVPPACADFCTAFPKLRMAMTYFCTHLPDVRTSCQISALASRSFGWSCRIFALFCGRRLKTLVFRGLYHFLPLPGRSWRFLTSRYPGNCRPNVQGPDDEPVGHYLLFSRPKSGETRLDLMK